MTRRLVRRALNFQGRHAQAISLVLSFALCVALIVAVLGWRSARDAQRRLTSVELQLTTEKIGKDIADVTTCFNAAKRRPGLIVILQGIAVELEPDPRQALNELIDQYGQDTPTVPDCVALARKRGIDPKPYVDNPPSEAGEKEPR